MLTKNKCICIIPARKGSKRIKNKNIINFLGKPMIYYSIKAAQKSKIFSKIIVSTDCKKIANISKKYGAEVPFFRNKKLSNDKATTKDVLVDAIKKINSKNIEFHCLIYPTAPLIKYPDLKKAFKLIQEQNADCIMTVCKYQNHPLRSLVNKNNFLQFKWKHFQKKFSRT